MLEKHIRGGSNAHHNAETNTSATLQPDRTPCPAPNDSDAITEIVQDNAEAGILFRPRLYFVPEK